jgi:hypothetical protein
MTPKEKAKALVEKFLKMEYGVLEEYFPSTHTYLAKQCAIICVNEILNLDPKIGLQQEEYWHNTLTEITNL